MRHRETLRALPAMLLVLFVSGVVRAQDTPAPTQSQDFDMYVDEQFAKAYDAAYERKVATEAGIRDPSNQVELPAATSNPSTLLDTSSAADLFSVALNLAELTWGSASDSGDDATSIGGSATAWAFYTALEGIDPLEPSNYCSDAGKIARRLSLSLGHEAGDAELDDATLIGVKVSLGKDACDADLDSLDPAQEGVAGLSGRISDEVRPALADDARIEEADVNERFQTDPQFAETAKEHVDAVIAEQSFVFDKLAGDVWQAIQILEREHGFALQLNAKVRDGTGDEYIGKLIYEYGFESLRGVRFTANGAGNIRRNDDEADSYGGTLGLGLRWQGKDTDLRGRRPLQVSVSGDANWLTNAGDTYRANAKVVLPIMEGIELPISLTVANRTELVAEDDVRGLVGFTVDTTQLMAAFQR